MFSQIFNDSKPSDSLPPPWRKENGMWMRPCASIPEGFTATEYKMAMAFLEKIGADRSLDNLKAAKGWIESLAYDRLSHARVVGESNKEQASLPASFVAGGDSYIAREQLESALLDCIPVPHGRESDIAYALIATLNGIIRRNLQEALPKKILDVEAMAAEIKMLRGHLKIAAEVNAAVNEEVQSLRAQVRELREDDVLKETGESLRAEIRRMREVEIRYPISSDNSIVERFVKATEKMIRAKLLPPSIVHVVAIKGFEEEYVAACKAVLEEVVKGVESKKYDALPPLLIHKINYLIEKGVFERTP